MKTALDGSTGAPRPEPVGVVLAGGSSRRMGRDKTLLTSGGESLPAMATRRLAAVCAEVAVADRGRGLLPGVPSLPDGPGRGPAAGILGAAEVYPGRRLLVLACDLPRVPEGLLAALADPLAADWVVPRWREGVEPLCALYGPAALAALGRRIARGLFALHELAEEDLAVCILEGEGLARFGDPEEIFLNLNAPEDWERYVASDSISRRNS
ncbi:MAG TPA: molybdenum cofactor guanylyltransferase [Thermoanaerobaculia bacterium]|jgi:molybdopterin-guanine dinucleotide biosynthesis protein A